MPFIKPFRVAEDLFHLAFSVKSIKRFTRHGHK